MSWSVDCAHSWGSLLTRPRDHQWQLVHGAGRPSLVDLQENRRTKEDITGTEEAVCSLCVVWPASEGYCKLASWHAREEGQGLPSHPLPCTRGRVGPFCGWTSEREREREREREADRQTDRETDACRRVPCRAPGVAAAADVGGRLCQGRWARADVQLAEQEQQQQPHARLEPLAHLDRRLPGPAAERVPDVLLQVSVFSLSLSLPVGSLPPCPAVVQLRDEQLLHAQLLHALRRALLLLLLMRAAGDTAHLRPGCLQLR